MRATRRNIAEDGILHGEEQIMKRKLSRLLAYFNQLPPTTLPSSSPE
jgi:hypothetical protein